ncbi:MAG: hypothetical protein ACRC0F_07700 [Cetobacterium sp.]
MKRIISLKKISPFLTEIFREDLKIGDIVYQDNREFKVEMDDIIAQNIMDAEILAIRKSLEEFMDHYTIEKMQDMNEHNILILIPELNRVKTQHVGTINQTFTEKQQLLLKDYENYKKSVASGVNEFKVSVEAEKKNLSNLATTETLKIQTESSKQLGDIGLLGDAKKNTLETDYLGYRTELESLVNINNFEKIIGKNFKGSYDPWENYQIGDIFYKDSLINISFSIPNISAPVLTKNLAVEKVGKFLIYGESEQEFQLCSNKQFGVVGLNLGETVIKESEVNSTSALFPVVFNVVSFSIPSTSAVEVGKTLVGLKINSPTIEKINIEMPIHKNLIGTASKYQY